MNIETIVAALSILGTLLVAGRLVFRTEAKVEQAHVSECELRARVSEAERKIATLQMEHGTSSTATSKDVEALKRDLDRFTEAMQGGMKDLQGGMKDLGERVHALALAVRARGKGPGDSA